MVHARFGSLCRVSCVVCLWMMPALAKDLEINRWICSSAEEPPHADPSPRIHHRRANLPCPGLQPVPHTDLKLMQLSPGDHCGCACGKSHWSPKPCARSDEEALATVTAMDGPTHGRWRANMVKEARLHADPGDRSEQRCEGQQGHATQFGPSEVQLSSNSELLFSYVLWLFPVCIVTPWLSLLCEHRNAFFSGRASSLEQTRLRCLSKTCALRSDAEKKALSDKSGQSQARS